MTVTKTPNLSLPFPEGNELVIGGDDAIERLARGIDRLFESAHFAMWEDAVTAQAIDGALTFPLALSTASGHFTDTGDSITYTGPSRDFILTADVGLAAIGTSAGPWQYGAALRINGQHLAGEGAVNPEGVNAQSASLNFGAPVRLSSGDVITLVGSSTRSGTMDASVRGTACGPAYGVTDL